MNNMVNLLEIKKTIEALEYDGGDDPLKYLENALDQLEIAYGAMNTISVCGRDNVDSLLGCMIGIEMIIGKEAEDGRDSES